MKKIIITLFIGVLFLFFNISSFSQCTPGNATTCPDPENNGQICPDSLPDLMLGEYYSESITILPPPEVEVIPGFPPVALHHIQVMDIQNLPLGISWVSNAPDSIFMVGTYYCVLLDGTPTDTGTYFLKIIVDAYIPGIGGSDPIFLGTTVDSTSVALTVHENQSSIFEFENRDMNFISAVPNPFSGSTNIKFIIKEDAEIEFVIFNLVGEQIYKQSIFASAGKNTINYDGRNLTKGMYLFSISSKTSKFTNIFIKLD